jgi:type IV secretion system protein VirB10
LPYELVAGTVIAAALVTGMNSDFVTSGSVTVAVRQSSQDSLNQVGQITRKNLKMQPTLTGRPGFPLRIIVNRDLMLRPVFLESPCGSGHVERQSIA